MPGQQDRWEHLDHWDPQDSRDAVTLDLPRLIEQAQIELVQQERLRADGGGNGNGNGAERSPRPVRYRETDAAVERDIAARAESDRREGADRRPAGSTQDGLVADDLRQAPARLAELPRELQRATTRPPWEPTSPPAAQPDETTRPPETPATTGEERSPSPAAPRAEPRHSPTDQRAWLRPEDEPDEAGEPPAEQPDDAQQRQSPEPDAVKAEHWQDGPAVHREPGSLADLRQRLELLPVGHPSSPYHDDGTRKPPPPRLKHLELAPPGRDRTAEAARPGSAGVAEANGVEPQTAGVVKASEVPRFAPESGSPGRPYGAGRPSDVGRPAASSQDTIPDVRSRGSYPTAASRDSDVERPDGERIAAVRAEAPPSRDNGLVRTGGPHTEADGSWHWGPASLRPDQARLAQDMHERLRAAEGRDPAGSYHSGGLTAALHRIEAELEHGRLAPEADQQALIDPNVFRATLAGLIRRHPEARVEDLSRHVSGALSYAFVFDAAHYSVGAWLVHDALRAQGFRLDARKNGWNGPEHRYIVSSWLDPSHDVLFQVQFHTTASFDAHRLARASANMIADPRTPPVQVASLRSDLASAWAAVAPPPGIAQIGDYRRPGR